MNPVKFPGCNVVYGKDQESEGYIPLPANFNQKTGMAITQWELSDDEIKEIVRNKRIFIGISTFGKPLQPILPTVMAMFHPGEEPELPKEEEIVRPTFGHDENKVKDVEMEICPDCPDKEHCVNKGCIKK